MKIYLLKRIGKKGQSSLYLVYSNGKGKRQYEFLKLYLYESPKDTSERQQNKETMKLAKTIQALRMLDLQYSQHGLISPVKGKVGLLSFFKQIMDSKDISLNGYNGFKSCLKHLRTFLKDVDMPIERVDEVFLDGFADYLLTQKFGAAKRTLSPNSALSYQVKLKIVLKAAFQKRYIKENIVGRMKSIKGKPSKREFLTVEEVRKLAQTPCEIEDLKRMFLWSCATGMRWSDTINLTGSKIKYTESSGYYVEFTQVKTGSNEIHPVPEYAIQLLPRKDDAAEPIFAIQYSAHLNSKLQAWIKSAGINKKITYHSSRHTYAVLMTSLTDIYTVSKLLAHKNVRTTEIYAKVSSQAKIEATNKFPNLLIN